MDTVTIAATASRTVLGSMSDFVNMPLYYPPGLVLLERAVSSRRHL
jgi:hypothetical protein